MRYRSRTSRSKKFGGKPTAGKLHKESNKSKTPPRSYEFVVVKISDIKSTKELFNNGSCLWKLIRSQLESGFQVYKYFADVEIETRCAVFLVKTVDGKYLKPELTVVASKKDGKLSWIRIPDSIKLRK